MMNPDWPDPACQVKLIWLEETAAAERFTGADTDFRPAVLVFPAYAGMAQDRLRLTTASATRRSGTEFARVTSDNPQV